MKKIRIGTTSVYQHVVYVLLPRPNLNMIRKSHIYPYKWNQFL